MPKITASEKDQELVRRALNRGIILDAAGARVLRRAALVLSRWDEAACGADGWHIERDCHGFPWRVVHAASHKDIRYRIPDAEAHAERRAMKVAEQCGFSITRQPDPRGCPLYIWNPLSGSPDPWGGVAVSG